MQPVNFRVPPRSSKIKVAKCGKAFGFWNGKNDTFQFNLPRTICSADVTFTGTTGVYKFHFNSNSTNASHIRWEHLDYEYDNEAFLLDRAFTRRGRHPRISELPFPRVSRFTDYHNPTRPNHLVGGALVRRRRSYSPTEIRNVKSRDMEQSPAYLARRRVRSVSRSFSRSPSGGRSSSRSRRSPFQDERLRSPPRKVRARSPYSPMSSGSPSPSGRGQSRSYSRSHSRSPRPEPKKEMVPAWVRSLRNLPIEHSKFIWDIVSFIKDEDRLSEFATGVGISPKIVKRAVANNEPLNTTQRLEDCVAQTLTDWWVGSSLSAIGKSDRIRHGFKELGMPGLYACIISRHPALDPFRALRNQDGSLPGSSGLSSSRPIDIWSSRPAKYMTMEYIQACLKESEREALTALSHLITNASDAFGLACVTVLPDVTYVFIRSEHSLMAQAYKKSETSLQNEIAFHILAIWYVLAKDVPDRWEIIREMFLDMKKGEKCAKVLESFPWTKAVEGRCVRTSLPTLAPAGASILKKGISPKSSTGKRVSPCSSMSPSRSIGENGEEGEMEEQVPQLIDQNENIHTSEDDTIEFELEALSKARLIEMGESTQKLGKSATVTFALTEKEKQNPPPNPYVKLSNIHQRSNGVKKGPSDKL